MDTHELGELAANDIFHEIHGVGVWVLHLAEHEHLGAVNTLLDINRETEYHLGYFLGIFVLPNVVQRCLYH